MTPFAGAGVNLAMEDALELSRSIQTLVSDQSTSPDAIKDYETLMFNRAMRHAQETLDNLTMMFSGDGAEDIVLKVQSMMGGERDEENRR
jgi:2-polyprenyl-6-methoxyphenol hydroxylase-like FAD-dependent oxidoreductase